MSSGNNHGIPRRKALLLGAAGAALWGSRSVAALPTQAVPLPLSAVRLKPSIYLDAVAANRRYLHSLDPNRLLHNFRTSAGLAPKGEVYGGWESRGIAGHTLGHYLSACALMHAQTGDPESLRRVRYIVAELAACQAAHGDGYVGGTTVERGGREVDGKVVFEELRRGEIRSSGFDLNGGWVPLYTWHKVHAGLLDAHALCGDHAALRVAVAACGYLGGIFDRLSDEQMQQVLAAEHGGLNETFAETFARTGDRRWLLLAQRLHHRKVLDPLVEARDALQGLHANTQIPKVIGLARLHELTGDAGSGGATRFFWQAVTTEHSYVIGGNSEREHFGRPRALGDRLTDQTCESCNTYNMLKLTRHLYAWTGHAAYFDYYERAHLNHIMSQQDPASGMFTYMTPMLSGAAKRWSSPTEDFWCCVGSGMESHAKHGDSIYWRTGDTLLINLFIPSSVTWAEQGLSVELDTAYPASETVTLRVTGSRAERPAKLALRIPGWCKTPRLEINGRAVAVPPAGGYAVLDRRWRVGDTVRLTLPMTLRVEPLPDDLRMVAFVHGPTVLAADLGDDDVRFEGPAPALVGAEPLGAMQPVPGEPQTFRTGAVGRPTELKLRPFYAQYHRRTAVYLPIFSEERWRTEQATLESEQAARRELDRRTVDVLYLGEMQPERDHGLTSEASEPVSYMGRSGRLIRAGGFIACKLAAEPGAVVRITQGGQISERIVVEIDGRRVPPPAAPSPGDGFVDRNWPLPVGAGSTISVRISSPQHDWVSFYEIRVLRP